MIYRVTISSEANAAIAEHVAFIQRDSPDRARDWMLTLFDKIESLSEMPRRYGFARENELLPEELRQFVHHSHRVIYTVLDGSREVVVLRVRHVARKTLLE